ALLAFFALLGLAEAALLHLFQQLLELLAQRLLVLLQIVEGVLVAFLTLLTLLTLLALLALLALLPALPPLAALALLALLAAALVLAFAEGAVAQLLLLADHVAELVEHRHHVVVAVLAHLAGARHLQVFQHLLQLVEQ